MEAVRTPWSLWMLTWDDESPRITIHFYCLCIAINMVIITGIILHPTFADTSHKQRCQPLETSNLEIFSSAPPPPPPYPTCLIWLTPHWNSFLPYLTLTAPSTKWHFLKTWVYLSGTLITGWMLIHSDYHFCSSSKEESLCNITIITSTGTCKTQENKAKNCNI